MNSTDLAPSVQMAWDGRVVQWTPDEAIRHAFNMLEVRVAAEEVERISFLIREDNLWIL